MRAFTGIDLPAPIKKSLSLVQARMPQENVSIVRQEAMHITLHFFENISEDEKQKVIAAMQSVSIGKFEARINGISCFGGRNIRVVFAHVDDPEGRISTLYERIGTYLDQAGVQYDKKERFVPHITLARCRVNSTSLRLFIEENANYDFGSLTIHRVFLKKSELSGSSPVYTTLFDYDI